MYEKRQRNNILFIFVCLGVYNKYVELHMNIQISLEIFAILKWVNEQWKKKNIEFTHNLNMFLTYFVEIFIDWWRSRTSNFDYEFTDEFCIQVTWIELSKITQFEYKCQSFIILLSKKSKRKNLNFDIGILWSLVGLFGELLLPKISWITFDLKCETDKTPFQRYSHSAVPQACNWKP